MVFTSNGVSGPVILSASRHAMKYDYKNLVGSIDLSEDKPADKLIEEEKRKEAFESLAFLDKIPK